jgi:hypothetical protein
MSQERLLTLSRRLSECEELARQVRNHSGITDALSLAQVAVARQLGRLADPDAKPEPDIATVLASFRDHLRAAGHGGQARLAMHSGVAATTLSKFGRTGQISEAQLARLASALDQTEAEGPR